MSVLTRDSAPLEVFPGLTRHDSEQWRRVPGWPHEASTHGRIRSLERIDAAGSLRLGVLLAQTADKRPGKGYLYATLWDGKHRRRKAGVHVLVLEAWADPKPGPEYEGCHGNGVRTDNHLDNLRWDTREANRADMLRHRQEREQSVTDQPLMAQIWGFPRWARFVIRHGASVTSARTHGTGSLPIPSSSSPYPIPLNPSSRTVRTILHALRNRQAA